MSLNIVLAHGVLGFSAIGPVNYFNGIKAHLEGRGHKVLTPQVNPVGGVKERSEQLGKQIRDWMSAPKSVHVIAHSMGGLDARSALRDVIGVAERVTTLVTIGTPHRGSPVADAIATPFHPLKAHIPERLLQVMSKLGAVALNDLTTQVATEFDSKHTDIPGVKYIEIAGDALKTPHELLLFRLAEAIGMLNQNGVNDGVVTRSSALRGRNSPFPDWPVDHAGEIGWSLEFPVPIISSVPRTWVPRFAQPLLLGSLRHALGISAGPHFARYDQIIDNLIP